MKKMKNNITVRDLFIYIFVFLKYYICLATEDDNSLNCNDSKDHFNNHKPSIIINGLELW